MDQGATIWKHDLELTAHGTSAARARRFVGQRLIEHELQYLADDVQLVVSELATNALTHARTPFTVTLAAVAQSLVVKVRDGSPCLPVSVDGSSLDTAGRGVTIVALLSRDWGVTAHADGGKTVWAAFDTWQGFHSTLCPTRSSRSRTTSPSKPRAGLLENLWSLPAPRTIPPCRLGFPS